MDAAFGVGIAVATCRWWPVHRDEPADSARPKLPVPALPSGEGLVVVVNSDAGGEVPAEVELRTLLPKADLRVCEAGEDLHTVLRQAATEVQARGGALGVVGGDGTVNAAAVLAVDNRLPLAVFPGGTLNHFAADLGLPTLKEAADAVEAGRGGAVDLGRITGDGDCTYFLNTFSIGVYPELVRAREARERALGKWPALAIGLLRVLADGAPIDVTLDGQPGGCGCSSPATVATTRPASHPPTAAPSTTASSTCASSTENTPSPAPASSRPSSPEPSPAPASTRKPPPPACASTVWARQATTPETAK
ncbi:diacylglycerol kinase family protein [Streptomyces sp. NPDC050147]|uniref:diacylglycerol/lipid kinase family protein n=1 Tax=Streptomyces sp. NPDC050147 TaxID=3155513 RepID=UPI00342A2F93